nr:unnamed protein product [Digitaria exilis]
MKQEIFQIRKGQPERILQDVVGGRELRLVSSVVAEFHMSLLSVIQEGKGKNKLRNWIDMQNDVAAEPMNAARGKARAAKEKEKELKERLKGNMDKAMFSPNEAAALSNEENKDLIAQIEEAKKVKHSAING